MLDTLDAIIATAAVVLGLSLVVQSIQQIFKQWRDLKSIYMKVQVLSMFAPGKAGGGKKFQGLGRVSSFLAQAGDREKMITDALEDALASFGYKDLEALEGLSEEQLKKIVKTIDWSKVQGASTVLLKVKDILKEVDVWFDVAKRSFQDMYERRMKYWAFGISLVVVIVFNANIFHVYQQFSLDKTTRDAAVRMAERFVAMPRDSILVKEKSAGRDSIYIVEKSDSLVVEDIKKSLADIQSVVGTSTFQLFRWTKSYRDPLLTDWLSVQWFKNWVKAIFGWLGMTLLVSLGAPFWYDFLKAIMGFKNSFKGKPEQVSAAHQNKEN